MVNNISVSAQKKDLESAIGQEVAKFQGVHDPILDSLWNTVAPLINTFSETSTIQVSFVVSDENVNTSVRKSINLSINVI